MSVLMTLRVKADPAKFEEYAAQNKEKMQAIANRGREHGAIHHAFYGSDDGTLLVIDEWDSPESFQAFFDASPDIGEVMQGSDASSEPEVTFWRKLEGHDEF